MDHRFSPGELVVCIERHNARLTERRVYRILSVQGNGMVHVKNDRELYELFFPHRFKLAKPQMVLDLIKQLNGEM